MKKAAFAYRCGFWFLVLTMIYILSIGPVYWAASRGWFGQGVIVWPSEFYAPVWRLEQTPFKNHLYWWIDLFSD